MSKKDNSAKQHRLFLRSGTFLNRTGIFMQCQMPLSLDNNLPSTVLRFGYTDKYEIALSFYLDSCAAMNTGNYLLHMWILVTYS